MAIPPVSKLVTGTMKSPTTSGDCKDREARTSTKREIVTVTVTREDYFALKAIGGPYPDEITKALKYLCRFGPRD